MQTFGFITEKKTYVTDCINTTCCLFSSACQTFVKSDHFRQSDHPATPTFKKVPEVVGLAEFYCTSLSVCSAIDSVQTKRDRCYTILKPRVHAGKSGAKPSQ